MKNFSKDDATCIANFMSHVNENHFLPLYLVVEIDELTFEFKIKSVCFLSRDEALEHLHYLSKTNHLNGGKFAVHQTSVYMG